MVELIYCAGGNRRFDEIAKDAGFLLGAQLPKAKVYFPIHFADQNWKNPDMRQYMAALAQHRPHMASVIDLEKDEQLHEVLSWAEEAAQWVSVVMIIPKVFGIIPRLPRRIAGAEVRLGYSVPTSHGGTEVPVWEFDGWPVHLLGGSPQAQMRLTHYLRVTSVDGNMANKMATSRCQFWVPGNAKAKDRYWPTLSEADGKRWEADAPYEAFRRSCVNIVEAWRKCANGSARRQHE